MLMNLQRKYSSTNWTLVIHIMKIAVETKCISLSAAENTAPACAAAGLVFRSFCLPGSLKFISLFSDWRRWLTQSVQSREGTETLSSCQSLALMGSLFIGRTNTLPTISPFVSHVHIAYLTKNNMVISKC